MGSCNSSGKGGGGGNGNTGNITNELTPGGNLPNLSGTDKQIDYANNIRKQAYKDIENSLNADLVLGRSGDKVYYNQNQKEVQTSVEAAKQTKRLLDTVFNGDNVKELNRVIDTRNGILSMSHAKNVIEAKDSYNRQAVSNVYQNIKYLISTGQSAAFSDKNFSDVKTWKYLSTAKHK